MAEPAVGLCGLGNMGLALAKRLRVSRPVVAIDPLPERQRLATEAGIEVVADLPALASRTSTVVLSLPRPSISRAVIEELLGLLAPGGLIIETSTVTPSDIAAVHGLATSAGIGLIDAAVLSGVAITERGDGALLIGGVAADIERAKPVLDAIAGRQTHFSSPGAGMAAKVINNAVAHAVYVVLVEAAAIGTAAGLGPTELVELLSGDDSGLMRPLTHRIGERLAAGDYAGGMPTEAARKDSTLALQMAQELGVPLFGIQAAHTVYEIAAQDPELARADYAALGRLWEEWTGRRFSPEAGTGETA